MHVLIRPCVLLYLMIPVIDGHGRLIDPPSRVSAWRYGFNTPKDYTDHEYNCGGLYHQYGVNNGKCGICGDSWELSPRPSEAGGKYATGTIVKTYSIGQTISISVELTANHLGYFEFKICPVNNPSVAATQGCLDGYPLLVSDTNESRHPVESRNGVHVVAARLPPGLVCAQCVLQWRYKGGNNWGACPDGPGAIGCGIQEEFRACADVAITKNGDLSGSESPSVPVQPAPPVKPVVTNPPVVPVTPNAPAIIEVPNPPQPPVVIQPPVAQTCSNEAFFKCPGDGLWVDPCGCSYFYNCWAGTAYHTKCADGTLFSESLKTCDWAHNIECTRRPDDEQTEEVEQTACSTKKKCKKKGGSCINNSLPCNGKIIKKGCKSKSCKCCAPKAGKCKRSKKCSRAGGRCLSSKVKCIGTRSRRVCKGKTCVCCMKKKRRP